MEVGLRGVPCMEVSGGLCMYCTSRGTIQEHYSRTLLILTTNSNHTSSLSPIPGTAGLPQYCGTLDWGMGFGQVAECLPRPVPIKPLPSNPYPPPVRVDVTCDEAQVGRLEGFPALAVSGVI